MTENSPWKSTGRTCTVTPLPQASTSVLAVEPVGVPPVVGTVGAVVVGTVGTVVGTVGTVIVGTVGAVAAAATDTTVRAQ